METLFPYYSTNLSDQLSDSDDESSSEEQEDEDYDEDELERRKMEYIHQMLDLEKQFEAIKGQLYRERLSQAERKLDEVRAETSDEYLQPLQELQDQMKIRTEVAGVLREMRLKNAKCVHEAENVAAEQNLEDELHALKEQIRLDLEEKLRRLEDDRNSIDNDLWDTFGETKKKKKRYGSMGSQYDHYYFRDQLSLPDRRKKPVAMSGPYVVYMLHEHEIMDDWNAIRRAVKSAGTLTCY